MSALFLLPCLRIVDVPVDTSELVKTPLNVPTAPHGSVKVPAPAPPPTLEFTVNPDVPKLFGLTRASQSLGQTGASSLGHPFSVPTRVSAFGVAVSEPSSWKISQVGPDAPLQKNSASSTANTGLPSI